MNKILFERKALRKKIIKNMKIKIFKKDFFILFSSPGQ